MLLCIVTHSLLNAKHTPVIQQFQKQNGILESWIIGHGTSSVCVLPSGVWLNDNFVSLATCKKFANQCLHKYMKGVEAVNKWFMFSTVWYSYSYWMGEVVEAAGEELTLKYVLCRTWCESNVIWAGAGLGCKTKTEYQVSNIQHSPLQGGSRRSNSSVSRRPAPMNIL